MSWLFSQALVAEYSAASCSGGEPSALLSANPTPQAFLPSDRMTAFSRPSRFGMTFAPSTESLGVELLTWFLEASRARTSAPPARAQESTASAPAYGDRWRELSVRYDRDSSSWRTHRSLWDEDLSACSLTLPKWGSMHDGVLSELLTLEHRTAANDAGLWPTPTVSGNHNRKGSSVKSGDGLATAVKQWPTPTSSLGTKGGRITQRKGREGGTLIEAVSARTKWPTPTACMSKGSSPAALTRKDWQDRSKDRLDHAVMATSGGALNPTWVELLMGWPENWSCIEPISRVRYAQWLMENCNDEETRVREVLRVLRCGYVAEEVSRKVGRHVGIREAAVLLADVCQYTNRPDQARILVACAEALDGGVRSVRSSVPVAGASHESGYQGQQTGEHPDALQALSRLLAHYGKAAWQDGSWENAVPRVAHKVAARVDRLRCIGNGQVPGVAAMAWRILSMPNSRQSEKQPGYKGQ
jgi:hypothetical protein